VKWRALLWKTHTGRDVPPPPAPSLVTVPAIDGMPGDYLAACGFYRLGARAVRVDVLDRLAVDLQRQSRAGDLAIGAVQLNLLGLSMEEARPIFEALGYAATETEDGLTWKWAGRPTNKRGGNKQKKGKAGNAPRKPRKPQKIDENSPFAKLRELKLS